MALILRQSTARDVVVGPTYKMATNSLVTSGITPASIDCGIIKNTTPGSIVFTTIGAANHFTSIPANPGSWLVALTATDTNTVGHLRLTMSQAAVFTPFWNDFEVVEEAVFDALYASGGNVATAASVADAVLDELTTSHVIANSLSKNIADILTDTGDTGVKIGADAITSTAMADSSIAFIMTGIVEGTTTMATALSQILAKASGNVAKSGNAYAFKNRAGSTLFTLTVNEDAGTVTRS